MYRGIAHVGSWQSLRLVLVTPRLVVVLGLWSEGCVTPGVCRTRGSITERYMKRVSHPLAVSVQFVLKPLSVCPIRVVHPNLVLPLLQQLPVLLPQSQNLRPRPFACPVNLLGMLLGPWRGRVLWQLVWRHLLRTDGQPN
eukprot:1370118-Pyramimonas_sp.AAC.1